MLSRLYIQNYAIIDEIDIIFSNKLNIITGETGAGKSILIGALSLILGSRADSSVLVRKEKKCVIEGIFNIQFKDQVKELLAKEELENGDELVIRREIGINGKSRAFVNDTPVNLDQLRMVSSMLVDLHQQFDTLELVESNFQREVIDAISDNSKLIREYGELYSTWARTRKNLNDLKDQKLQFQKDFDYHKFTFTELEEANFSENELEDLENELRLQSNAEGIKTTLSSAVFQLSEAEEPVIQQIKSLLHQLQAYSGYHNDLPLILQRLQSAQIELQDISSELEHLNNEIQYDPKRIEIINDRMSLGYRLTMKHGVKTTNELIDVKNQLAEKLEAVLNIDEEIERVGKEEAATHKKLRELAGLIHESRIKNSGPIENEINQLLASVGMPNAKLKIEIKKSEVLYPHGADEIEFLFDANRSGQFMPLARVASGGELSRLMLCIKSIVANKIDLPTMIFDEIDTGISGEAARQVGFIQKELASSRQVICITHLPQIAGRADAHFYVFKEIVKDQVKTNIKLLTMEERITAIAKMLSGEKPTAAALENAREMVMK